MTNTTFPVSITEVVTPSTAISPESITLSGSIDLNALAAALAPVIAPLLGTPVNSPPVNPPVINPAGAVYYNGKFLWPQDYDWNSTVNYADTKGIPLSGVFDIALSITKAYGGWQPVAPNKSFDTSPYKYLCFATKPTMPSQVHGIGFEAIDDVPDGIVINLGGQYGTGSYGPMPQPGVWGRYKIPLADFKLTNPLIQKFMISDGTGLPTNLFYIDEVFFG